MEVNWENCFLLCTESPTGLRWKHAIIDSLGRVGKIKAGDVAGGPCPGKCHQVMLNGKTLKCHRIIYEMLHGKIPKGLVIDHKDRNPLNNTWENLVPKTQKHNTRNCKRSKNNSTGVTGVCFWVNRDGHLYARAQWTDLGGVNKCKSFRADILGLMPAFSKAVQHRKEQINLLNLQGAQYTEGHGE